LNVTLPVGVTPDDDAPLGVIVAVRVTNWLTTAVVGRLEITVVTGVFLVTVCGNGVAFVPLKLVSPEYVAPITSDGATSALVVHVARWVVGVIVRLVQRATAVPPMVKDMVPVGTTVKLCAAVKVAVKVTD